MYPCELEVKWDIIDSQEDRRCSCGGTDEEKYRSSRKHHLNRENSSLLGLPWHVQSLTECEGDQGETKAYEAANDLGTVPRVLISTELKPKNQRADAATEQDKTNPIDFPQTSHERGPLEGIERWNEEDDNGCNECPDGEIDVKCPSPTTVPVGESSADNRPQNSTQSPHCAGHTDVLRSKLAILQIEMNTSLPRRC